MIPHFLTFGAMLFVKAVSAVLSTLEWLYPTEIIEALYDYATPYLVYTSGFFPLVQDGSASGLWGTYGILDLMEVGLYFYTAWYLMKLLVWGIKLMPFVHADLGHYDMPHGSDTPLDLRPKTSTRKGVVDLRRGKKGTKRYLADIR